MEDKISEDPIIMYLIVKESLKMDAGKTGSQIGHAVGMLYEKYHNFRMEIELYFDPVYGPSKEDLNKIPENLKQSVQIWDSWKNSLYRKVVLKADDKEFEKIKSELKDQIEIVIDVGLTQVPTGSETCLGVYPMYKSKAPKTLKRLRLLK